ncbi:MAG: spore germination protein [Clostridia bacterium]|nr:spore germination protein [Clostridia bacterium]
MHEGYHPERSPLYPGAVTHENICAIFDGAGDFLFRELSVCHYTLYIYSIDGLTSGSEISEYVIRPLLEQLRGQTMQKLYQNALYSTVYNAVADPCMDLDTVAKKLVNGFSVVLFPSVGAIAFENKTGEKRGPSEPEVENTVKGAKDAFTETIRTNTSLVRRHLRTPDLRLTGKTVGRKSLTNVTVVWVKGLTNPEYVRAMEQRLDCIDIDGLLAPSAVEEYITGSRRTAFPLLSYTERTDKFCRGLLAGRVGLLVDGLPLGYLAPVDLASLMDSPEDRATDYVSASCIRVLRYAALLISLLLPGLYIAMTAFHQEMLPTKLLLSLIESKTLVPFPTIFEVLSLLIAFELLQEAGVSLPQAIGQTISIIGGLVVGTAAVEAKLISPAALIVVSIAGICGFVLPGKDFSDAVRVWRFAIAACAGFAGLFGMSVAFLLLLLHLASLMSLGVPYLSPFSSISGLERLLRPRLKTMKYRDPDLHPENIRNQR